MATNNNTKYERHTFKSFLEKYHVVIPMVQRDYAQGRTTDDVNRVRRRFLNAIKNNIQSLETPPKVMKMDFVYGERNNIWNKEEPGRVDKIIITPLDGQQRLTTLYLLHWFAARKANVNKDNCSFLNHFTYEIRPSSRDFCVHLMEFVPSEKETISTQIKDQHWFMAEWHNDPTIISMLVMIDAIKEQFDKIENLWQLLIEEERIIFYFLPLSGNGLSDELYIKMNSRGKKLTAFEHFKAEFEALFERDSDESNYINHHFDVEWLDVFFPYRNPNDNTVDTEFMRYFFYISHILCYRMSINKSNDEFELIKLLYDDNTHAKENRDFLKDALDCWYNLIKNGESIDEFFKKYLSYNSYEFGKVSTFKNVNEYGDCQNFFTACIKLYQVNNNFSYGDFLFLFGIITYLMHKDTVQEKDFVERLRILRNLIMNSNSGEIRSDSDYMHDLLDEVETLILHGQIKSGLTHSFNSFQEKEEQAKYTWKTSKQDTDVIQMYKFEDHPMVYGSVSGFGYDNTSLVDEFYKLFSQPYFTIHQAMISIDDYRQKNGNRHFMGNHNRSTWVSLLHSRSREGFSKTMDILINLLKRLKSGETLNDIINKFVEEQTQTCNFTWRYYFAKYADMLRGADGELVWGRNNYEVTTLNKHQFNGQHWYSFLNVLYKIINNNKVGLDNYGDTLTILKASLTSTHTGFVYNLNGENEDWTIHQSKDGIDCEDRVQMAVKRIRDIINR